MPKLIAKEKFYYAGRNLEVGEAFEAEEKDVALLTDSVSPRATLPPKAMTEAFETRSLLSEQETASPERRRYNRRDMRAKE